MLQKRVPSGREKDEAAIVLLDQLREKLHSSDVSTARKAAYQLSWMQEDGLDILTEALFGGFPAGTKRAAAYGLRSMNGRMRKMAEETLTKGLTHANHFTKEACTKSLMILRGDPAAKKAFSRRPKSRRPPIREVRGNRRHRSEYPSRGRPSGR